MAAIFYCSEGEVEQVCRGDGEEDAATERRTGRVEVDGRFSRVTASLASPPPVRP
ncbi:hypothetical protein [Microseira sp. BLCC-F43]|uniref:hypothetical protein n=1 Tax=Microseira sp. BLCC-F43 TaxID=3153602 RepID=UPI0035B9504C